MLEGLKKLFSGSDIFSKQLTLFSICGVMGLLYAFMSMEKIGISDVSLIQKVIFQILWIGFAFFLTGFETQFLHERQIPDISVRTLKILFSKTLMVVFVLSIPFAFVALFFPEYNNLAFYIEIALSVPLTMLQAGFSYNFRDCDAGKLFEKFGIKDYFILIFKRIFVIALAYILAYILVFIFFFVFGFVLVCIHHGDIPSVTLLISAQQVTILKLSNFISGIILMYFLTTATLVWDYELIKLYERED